jgi:ABC-type transporter Mla subunit MlaD
MTSGNRSQTRKALAGLGIAAAVVAGVVFVFFVPAIIRLLQPSMKIVALSDDAGTLQKESKVWLAGREVGTVLKVAVRPAKTDSMERVAITMRVPRKYNSQIRRDSQARITTARFIGEQVIDISPGSASAPMLNDMDSLRVRHRGTIEALLVNALQLDSSFKRLFASMRTATSPARNRTAELKRINRQLAASMTGMRELMEHMRRSPMRALSDPAMQRTLDHLRAQSRELSTQLNAAAGRARAAHNDARPSLERLARRADTISAVLADVKGRIAQGGGGILFRAQSDSAIVKGIHDAQVQLDSLMAVTKRSPLRFWF